MDKNEFYMTVAGAIEYLKTLEHQDWYLVVGDSTYSDTNFNTDSIRGN